MSHLGVVAPTLVPEDPTRLVRGTECLTRDPSGYRRSCPTRPSGLGRPLGSQGGEGEGEEGVGVQVWVPRVDANVVYRHRLSPLIHTARLLL